MLKRGQPKCAVYHTIVVAMGSSNVSSWVVLQRKLSNEVHA